MEELTLQNLVSLNESNLANNFSLIIRKLNNQQDHLEYTQKRLDSCEKAFLKMVSNLRDQFESKLELQITTLTNSVKQSIKSLECDTQCKLVQQFFKVQERLGECLNCKLATTEEKDNKRYQSISDKLALLKEELMEKLYRKEDRVEVQKLSHEIHTLQSKNKLINEQLRHAQHKIEKMIILEEKTLMMKDKKQKQLIKDIQERIRTDFNKTLRQLSQSQNNIVTSSKLKSKPDNKSMKKCTFKKVSSIEPESADKMGFHSISLKETTERNQEQDQNKYAQCTLKQIQTVMEQWEQEQFRGNQNTETHIKFNQSEVEVTYEQDSIEEISKAHERLASNLLSYSNSYPSAGVASLSKNYQSVLNLIEKVDRNLQSLTLRVNGIDQQNQHLRRENQKLIAQNLAPIQKLVEQMEGMKQQNLKAGTNLDIIRDQIYSLERKDQKNAKVLKQISDQAEQKSYVKIDRQVKQMKGQFCSSFRDFRAKLQTKINQQDYEKRLTKYDEAMRLLESNMFLKADKMEVKKALLFLESKLKEIILIISCEEQTEKQALLTKKPIKCMSCNKDVDDDKFVGNANLKKVVWDGMPFKDGQVESLGRFGMTNFGTLSKKNKAHRDMKLSGHSESTSTLPTIDRKSQANSICC